MAQVNKPPPSRRRPKELKAFYEKPADVETSSDIIKEARSSLRTVRTKRPFTPLEDKRTLFGGTAASSPSERPPSAFSLGARHFDGSDVRPKSNTRLTPLDHSPSHSLSPVSPSSSGESLPYVAKPPKPPPSDPSRVSSGKRRTHKLKSALSQDGNSVQILPQPLERRLSNPLPSPVPPNADQLQRRVHSGPKERTKSPLKDGVPRVKSAENLPVHRVERERVKSSGSTRAESGYASDRPSSGSQSASSSREEEMPEDALYWNTIVSPALERLVPERAGKVGISEEDRLCASCRTLYNVLEEGAIFGRACSKRRRTALRTVFKLTDVSNPRVQLQAARLMMALGVSGNNLDTLSKLILKVSKDNSNDLFFLEDNILDLIVSQLRNIDFQTHSNELLVYLIGSVRFLTQNHNEVLDRFVKLGSFREIVRIMASVNQVNSHGGKPAKGSLGIMLQLMSTMRNFLDHRDHQKLFLSQDAIPEICRCMELYPSDDETMMHIARIFSKLTTVPDCCSVLGEYPTAFQSLLALVSRYQDRGDMVVRLSFALGNLTARNDDFRYCLFNAENAMETLLNALRCHFVRSLQSKSSDEERTKSENGNSKASSASSMTDDVLIKLIRVIANLSINQDIGPLIASNENCVDQLMQILDYKDVHTSEELVLNTVITINNLSFYDIIGSEIVERQMEISRLLVKLLMNDNVDGMVEATRVFGNLSRSAEVRDYLTSKKVDEMMVTLLDARNREVVYTACGVLINLMADVNRRHILKQEGGIKKLIDVLVDFGRSDWQLAGMVCMTLWNYSENITSSVDCFGEQETGDLIDKLVDFLDEDTAMETPEGVEWDNETREFMRSYWQTEFCPVASQLLGRVEKHQSDLVPIGDAS